MNATELTFQKKSVKYLHYLAGGLLFAFGTFFLVVSWFAPLSASGADYLKETGFTLAATGLAFLIAEYALRRESEDLLTRTIKSTLESNLGDARESAKIINRTLDRLQAIEDAVTSNSLSKVLAAKLDDPAELHLHDSLATMVENLHLLGGSAHWAKDVYREYLADVIQNTSHNTVALCRLTMETLPSQDGQGIKLVPSARRTDEILKKLMAKMESGSRYSVLSDVESWTDGKLKGFFDQSICSAREGVLIRRIFIITGEELRRGTLTPAAVSDVIKRHMGTQVSDETTGYHVRLYDTSDPSAPTLRGEAAALLRKHYGIFEPVGRGNCIQVKVEEADLSGLRLTNLQRGSADQDNFELFWRILKTDLTSDGLQEAKERWNRIASGGAPPDAGA
jgi:hypothetical protein